MYNCRIAMRVLVIGDIHSNLEAFTAVLEDAKVKGGFDAIWFLGDLVGYGPDPGPCIELLRKQKVTAIAGNHDRAAVGMLSLSEFNPYAAQACRWTISKLTHDEHEYLKALPEVLQVEDNTLVHGSLRVPLLEYLLSEEAAMATFSLMKTSICLVGHSHIPFLCHEEQAGCTFYRFPEGSRLSIKSGRWIINPGSVGQPRDGDPRASYLLMDTDIKEVTHYRVKYDIGAVQRKMEAAALPEILAQRLSQGW